MDLWGIVLDRFIGGHCFDTKCHKIEHFRQPFLDQKHAIGGRNQHIHRKAICDELRAILTDCHTHRHGLVTDSFLWPTLCLSGLCHHQRFHKAHRIQSVVDNLHFCIDIWINFGILW
jgi:hypothetical protein